ncbi:MAG: ATP-binding cassette domain-containing protein, partial [Pseudomonadota bacterium]
MRDTARLDVPYPAEGPISQAALAGLRRVTVEREGRRLIDGLSLGLPPDGITVIMGANGAGKSVCLRLLHGLIAPDDGQVTWRDRPLDDAARRQQSLVFQKPVLLRRSAGANIDFVLKARGRHDPARRDALLAHVGLGDHAGRPARSLSGGEQQRLALARALA